MVPVKAEIEALKDKLTDANEKLVVASRSVALSSVLNRISISIEQLFESIMFSSMVRQDFIITWPIRSCSLNLISLGFNMGQ